MGWLDGGEYLIFEICSVRPRILWQSVLSLCCVFCWFFLSTRQTFVFLEKREDRCVCVYPNCQWDWLLDPIEIWGTVTLLRSRFAGDLQLVYFVACHCHSLSHSDPSKPSKVKIPSFFFFQVNSNSLFSVHLVYTYIHTYIHINNNPLTSFSLFFLLTRFLMGSRYTLSVRTHQLVVTLHSPLWLAQTDAPSPNFRNLFFKKVINMLHSPGSLCDRVIE